MAGWRALVPARRPRHRRRGSRLLRRLPRRVAAAASSGRRRRRGGAVARLCPKPVRAPAVAAHDRPPRVPPRKLPSSRTSFSVCLRVRACVRACVCVCARAQFRVPLPTLHTRPTERIGSQSQVRAGQSAARDEGLAARRHAHWPRLPRAVARAIPSAVAPAPRADRLARARQPAPGACEHGCGRRCAATRAGDGCTTRRRHAHCRRRDTLFAIRDGAAPRRLRGRPVAAAERRLAARLRARGRARGAHLY